MMLNNAALNLRDDESSKINSACNKTHIHYGLSFVSVNKSLPIPFKSSPVICSSVQSKLLTDKVTIPSS